MCVVHGSIQTGSEKVCQEKQTEIITEFFNNIFHQENEEEIPNIEPCEMKIPFTEKDIAKAVKSLKQ